MPNSVNATSIVIKAPIVTNVVNTPQSPPPGFSVNVTANVNSYPRSIAQVRLIYSSSSNPLNHTIQMVFVSGNETTGLFFGIIPSNVSVNGVTVAYFVVGIDSSGFEGISKPNSFVVQPDHMPPTFTVAYPARGYLDTPIVNFTKVEVSFNLTDSGSGVRRVFVLYSNSTDPTHSLTNQVDLALAEGDRFDGFWTGFIPPMSNGTVIYEAKAVDFSANMADSSQSFGRQSYEVRPISAFRPYADIQIDVQNLNLTSRMLTVYFFISVNSPTAYAENFNFANVEVRQPSYDYMPVAIPRESGFLYQKSYARDIRIYDINLWPFDTYSIDITFDLYGLHLNASNTKVQFFLGLPTSFQFDNSTPATNIVPRIYDTEIAFHVELTRKPSLIDPFMQAIYAVFFVLGSVAWIRPSKISRRLELFVGLFTFVVVLLFTLTQILQSEGISRFIGLTVPQALLIGLIWSVTLLASASFAFGYLIGQGRLPEIVRTHRSLFRHAFNFGLASIALFVTWYSSWIFGINQYSYFLFEIKQIWVTVIAGLFAPPIIAVELDIAALASERRMTRKSSFRSLDSRGHTGNRSGNCLPTASGF
jgi:hypothetical protein